MLFRSIFWLGVPKQEIPRASLYTAGPPPKPSPRAVIHPFASAPSKAWPADRFAALAVWLRDERKIPVTIVGADTDDFTPFRSFDILRGASLDILKRTLQSATLFIGNDSGPAHMAAAFGLPATVLFGSSDPVIWAPWRTQSEIIASPGGLAAVPLEQVRQSVARLEARA